MVDGPRLFVLPLVVKMDGHVFWYAMRIRQTESCWISGSGRRRNLRLLVESQVSPDDSVRSNNSKKLNK